MIKPLSWVYLEQMEHIFFCGLKCFQKSLLTVCKHVVMVKPLLFHVTLLDNIKKKTVAKLKERERVMGG
jgi:hypothetical protein